MRKQFTKKEKAERFQIYRPSSIIPIEREEFPHSFKNSQVPTLRNIPVEFYKGWLELEEQMKKMSRK